MLKQGYTDEINVVMIKFYGTLSEKDRRRYAALEAMKLGNGGQQYICEVLGCDPHTVRKGTEELQEEISADERIRKLGGGKKNALKRSRI